MSVPNAQWTRPRIAVGPRPADWAAEAIRRGGGEVVTLDQEPVGLGWTDPAIAASLRALLSAYSEISWGPLPLAGVETMVEAGVIDRQRRWALRRGGRPGPVASHRRPVV